MDANLVEVFMSDETPTLHPVEEFLPAETSTVVLPADEIPTVVDSNVPVKDPTSTPTTSDSVVDTSVPVEETIPAAAGKRNDARKSSDKSEFTDNGSPKPSNADPSSHVEPSSSVSGASGTTTPKVVMGTDSPAPTNHPTVLSEPLQDAAPAISTEVTVALVLCGVSIFIVALAIFILLRKRARSRANDRYFKEGVDWETTSGRGGEDLEKNESTSNFAAGVPRMSLHGAVNSDSWESSIRGSHIESDDRDAIRSMDSTELSSPVPETVEIAVPPRFRIPIAEFSDTRRRNFFDDDRLMSVGSSLFSPTQEEEFSKEWETESMRRW